MLWKEGRQGSGYFKFKLFECKWFKFDCYLLKFPVGAYINVHTDPAPLGYEHHRLNIVLKPAEEGGQFSRRPKSANDFISPVGNKVKFRPDIEEHCVSTVVKGTRYVLSIGWLRRNKQRSSIPL